MGFTLLFWPAVAVSLSLLAWSVSTYRTRIAIAAAVLATPFALYFSVFERFRYFALLALATYYAVPVALAYRRRLVALICAVPFIAFVVRAAWLVIRSQQVVWEN